MVRHSIFAGLAVMWAVAGPAPASAAAGFNYQFNHFLVGIEGEYTLAAIRTNQTDVSAGLGLLGAGQAGAQSQHTISDNWWGSISGRAGVVFDRLLVYGKGGWVRMHTTDISTSYNATNTTLRLVQQSEGNVNGWLAGGGFEWLAAKNISLKLEYNYMRFKPDSSACTTQLGGPSATVGQVTCGETSSEHRMSVIKAGVNFLFNPMPSTVVARY